MSPDYLFKLYQDLQLYVGWSELDVERIHAAAEIVRPHVHDLVDDFYSELQRHRQARKVITGGQEQVKRLKETLLGWLKELFTSSYDTQFVLKRWQVGRKHVEIGLDQVYTNVALSRLRNGLIRILTDHWNKNAASLAQTIQALNKLIDLDLAIIEDAYQAEYLLRQKRVEKLITIGQMAGGLAHELRNPLNVVNTSVYYLRNVKNISEEKQQEHLTRIHRQVEQANSVITALTDFARLPLPEFQPFALQSLLEEVLLTAQVPESIEVSLDFEESLPEVLGDSRQLSIVFGNLVRNAIDAMPTGGLLKINAQAQEKDVLVYFEDTGEGISPENISQILEPFFSTKTRGIGLGLSISRAIVENHRGKIQASSELGKGSQFIIQLSGAEP